MKETVRELLRVEQEVFMPWFCWAGEGQSDFGYALAKVSLPSPLRGAEHVPYLFAGHRGSEEEKG